MREMLFFPLIWVKLLLLKILADFDDVGGNLFRPLSSDRDVCLCTDACFSWVKTARVIRTDPDLTRRSVLHK